MKKEGVLCPSRRSAGKEEPLSSQELLYKDSRQKTNHIFTPSTNFSGLAPSVNSGAMLMRSSTCHPPPKPPPVKGHILITGSRVEELQQRERERDTHLEPRCWELEKSVFSLVCASSCWGNWKCDWTRRKSGTEIERDAICHRLRSVSSENTLEELRYMSRPAAHLHVLCTEKQNWNRCMLNKT